MKKRTICFVLALVLCVGLVMPIGVAAATGDIVPLHGRTIYLDGQATRLGETLHTRGVALYVDADMLGDVFGFPVEVEDWGIGFIITEDYLFYKSDDFAREWQEWWGDRPALSLFFAFEFNSNGLYILSGWHSDQEFREMMGKVGWMYGSDYTGSDYFWHTYFNAWPGWLINGATGSRGAVFHNGQRLIPLKAAMAMLDYDMEFSGNAIRINSANTRIGIRPNTGTQLPVTRGVPIIPFITIRPFVDSDFSITMTDVYNIYSIHPGWGDFDMPAFYLSANGTVSFNRQTIIQSSIARTLDVGQRLERRYSPVGQDRVYRGYYVIVNPDGSYQSGNIDPLAGAGELIRTDNFWLFWLDESSGNFYYVDSNFQERLISFYSTGSYWMRNLAERYARIDTHGSSNDGRRLSLFEPLGFEAGPLPTPQPTPQPAQVPTPPVAVAQPITAPVAFDFNITLLPYPVDRMGYIGKDVLVSAPYGMTLAGMHLVKQIVEPGSGSRPIIRQILLWDLHFAKVSIGTLPQDSIVDIVLIEGTSFFDPNMIIHASVDNR